MELSIRANDMFIGTLLKSLEIEDLVCSKGVSQPCYLARSFIGGADAPSSFEDAGNPGNDNYGLTRKEGDDKFFEAPEDKFFEAPEDLVDFVDCPMQSPGGRYLSPQNSFSPGKALSEPPSFSRVPGLLPEETLQTRKAVDLTDAVDSFVKAQIIIVDQNSPLYNNVDKQVGSFLFGNVLLYSIMW